MSDYSVSIPEKCTQTQAFMWKAHGCDPVFYAVVHISA